MVQSAARLIRFLGADKNDGIFEGRRHTINETLCTACRFPADHANRLKLDDFFGNAQEVRHGPKGLSTEIGVQPSDNHADIKFINQTLNDIDNPLVEKMPFVYRNNCGLSIRQLEDFTRSLHHDGVNCLTCVACDTLNPITIINLVFEDLYFLPRDDRPPHTSNKLLGFPTEHAAADNFNASRMMPHSLDSFEEGCTGCKLCIIET